MEQKHLNYKDRINLGSYYTKQELVDIVFGMLKKHIYNIEQFCLLDTSCGYGSFLNTDINFKKKIGVDIDIKALDETKNIKNVKLFCQNSLVNVNRKNINILSKDKLIIVGNPPYNDTTSIIRKNIKKDIFQIDNNLKTRDLGISFLLSYNKLKADYICVLHPLSYLIKKANFTLLKNFNQNYKLIDSLVISSSEFMETSKTTFFPIVIALYKKDSLGMDYNFIKNYIFKTKEGKIFSLSSFDTISNYLTKYPNQNYVKEKNSVAKFWTMRDINALKRSRTFVNETTAGTIFITSNKLPYYCYVDIFKTFISHIPYYFGNCDVMINNEKFLNIKDCFETLSAKRFYNLKPYIKSSRTVKEAQELVENYFKDLLGQHYVY